MEFCFNKTTQFLMICLLGLSFQMSAQSSGSGTTYSQKVIVSEKAGKSVNSTQYEGAEATDFDFQKFIADNLYKKEFTMKSVIKTDFALTYHNFDSKSYADSNDGCTQFCEKVESVEKKPYLGVGATHYDDFEGVLIETVIKNSAAEEAGIMIGDVITHIEEVEIRSGCDLSIAIRNHAVGERIQIRYVRDTDPETLEATLGYRLKKMVTFAPCCNEPNVPEVAGNLQVDNSTIRLFPNPSYGVSNVIFNSTDVSPITMTITDLSGKEMVRKQYNDFDGYLNEPLDLRDETQGIYFLNIIQSSKVYSEKIILQRP